MKFKTIWIAVADGARARFYRSNAGGTRIEPALDFELVGDRRPSREMVTDRPGRTKDRAAHGRHAMEPGTDPHVHEQQALALQVAELLDEHRKKNAFDELIIVAPPKMLGFLREAMPEPLRRLVRKEEAKDLTKLSPTELPARLAQLV